MKEDDVNDHLIEADKIMIKILKIRNRLGVILKSNSEYEKVEMINKLCEVTTEESKEQIDLNNETLTQLKYFSALNYSMYFKDSDTVYLDDDSQIIKTNHIPFFVTNEKNKFNYFLYLTLFWIKKSRVY